MLKLLQQPLFINLLTASPSWCSSVVLSKQLGAAACHLRSRLVVESTAVLRQIENAVCWSLARRMSKILELKSERSCCRARLVVYRRACFKAGLYLSSRSYTGWLWTCHVTMLFYCFMLMSHFSLCLWHGPIYVALNFS